MTGRDKSIKTQQGFSLVELIIVIGLIGILGAVAISSFRGYRDNSNLRTAARDIATDIAATRGRAMSERVQYRIQFTTTNNTYGIWQCDDAGNNCVLLQTKTPTVFGTASGLTLANPNFGGGTIISFFTRGTLSQGSVQVVNGRNSTATVTVNPTGRTYVQFAIQ
ncbi:MAG: hypothetical protein CSYNP_03421 [Syntrophus sp. SKADARSKE-3]|nr:hypothetical protein [Syntrophus sp. SKADARSKE-3]